MGSILKNSGRLSSEHNEQAAVIEWWSLQHPRMEKLLFAIPNGGLRNKATAAKLRKEGVKPGVADMFLAVARGKYHGLFIEMKRREGGIQSKDQRIFQSAVEKQGFLYILAHGADQAIEIISGYLRLDNV